MHEIHLKKKQRFKHKPKSLKNANFFHSPLYMGWRSTRISGTDYYDFVDELLWAIYNRWPNVLVQFEDFSNEVRDLVLKCWKI